MTTPTHDPVLRKERDPFQPVTWRVVCPCGTAPTRKLAHDEAKEVMAKHPVEVEAS